MSNEAAHGIAIRLIAHRASLAEILAFFAGALG